MTFSKLYYLTKHLHISGDEVKGIPVGSVVNFLVYRKQVAYFLEPDSTEKSINGTPLYSGRAPESTWVLPIKSLDDARILPGIIYGTQGTGLNRTYGRRCRLVGCKLDDAFLAQNVGVELVLLPYTGSLEAIHRRDCKGPNVQGSPASSIYVP